MAVSLVLKTLHHAWQTLSSLGVRGAVMGGLALSGWKYVRATSDVDLLIAIDVHSGEEVLKHFQAAGFRPKRFPPITPLGASRVLQLNYESPGSYMGLQLDLLFADSEYSRTALDRRVPLNIPDIPVLLYMLTCEDLILHKLMAGRMIDEADVVALLQLNRSGLDWVYLRKWSDQLQLTGDLEQLWQRAFPGEPPPSPSAANAVS